jgi:hypothetical protein
VAFNTTFPRFFFTRVTELTRLPNHLSSPSPQLRSLAVLSSSSNPPLPNSALLQSWSLKVFAPSLRRRLPVELPGERCT